MGRSPAHSPIRVTVISLQRLSREKPLPLCGDDQERRSGVSPLCAGTGATERRSGVSPLCAGTIREEGLTMEVDKSRAALTSGETPLPLCGGRSGTYISRCAYKRRDAASPLRGRSGTYISRCAYKRRDAASPLRGRSGTYISRCAYKRRDAASPFFTRSAGPHLHAPAT